jgi:hypothetical protein
MLGVSHEEYSHCSLHPINDAGQGSANSSVIWALISSRLFDARAAKAYGATFFSPDRSLQLQILMIGFVDDSNARVNDFVTPDQSPDIHLQRATADAQLWHDLLSCSGGALDITRFAYNLLNISFLPPAPQYCTPTSNSSHPRDFFSQPNTTKASLLIGGP